MVWIQLINWLQQQDTLTLIIAGSIIIYLIYKGIIQIPGIKTKLKSKKGNSHIHCENYSDLGNRLSRLMVIKTEIDRQLNIDILKEQMDIVDQVSYNIRKKMESLFFKLLQKEKPEIKNTYNSSNMIAFQNVSKNTESIIRDMLRFIMKENHIPRKEAEFTLYTKNKVEAISNHITEDLNLRWHDGLGIDRQTFRKASKGKIYELPDLDQEVEITIIDTLRKCRDIFDKKWYEIIKKDNEAAALFPEIYDRVTEDCYKKNKEEDS